MSVTRKIEKKFFTFSATHWHFYFSLSLRQTIRYVFSCSTRMKPRFNELWIFPFFFPFTFAVWPLPEKQSLVICLARDRHAVGACENKWIQALPSFKMVVFSFLAGLCLFWECAAKSESNYQKGEMRARSDVDVENVCQIHVSSISTAAWVRALFLVIDAQTKAEHTQRREQRKYCEQKTGSNWNANNSKQEKIFRIFSLSSKWHGTRQKEINQKLIVFVWNVLGKHLMSRRKPSSPGFIGEQCRRWSGNTTLDLTHIDCVNKKQTARRSKTFFPILLYITRIASRAGEWGWNEKSTYCEIFGCCPNGI